MPKKETPKNPTPPQLDEANVAALMQEAFGTMADEKYLPEESEELDLDGAEQESEDEDELEDDADDGEEDDDDNDDDAGEDADDADDTDDDTLDDESNVGDDDGESEPAGGPEQGDGAEDTHADDLMALDMVVDLQLRNFRQPSDEFDPSIVGDEADFITDAQESLGGDYDEEYAGRMGRLAHRTALRSAKTRWEAGADDRRNARRDRATQSITAQVQQLAALAGGELQRVEADMARIYQDKCDAHGVDAANEIPVKVYFRLAGGKLSPSRRQGTSKSGVASARAKAQKKGAVRATREEGQLGRVRAGMKKKRSKAERSIDDLNAHLNTHKQIEDFFFGV